ncbi:hypothetical protein B6U91_00405 [Candidatus Pacearchaeota archaeon ex4484_71]|nr:MAG: hypothetical protein B6U91_00405 [Candidatus Pacearchaeota archaeon ex4484_71]
MALGLFSLAFYSTVGGGAIGNLLFQWEQAGVFSYILPFLVIFALVFGILSTMNLFGNNRAINAIISLSTALLSLQFNFVPVFFAEIFPKMGIILAIIVVVFILLGLFVKDDDGNLPGSFKTIMVVVIGIMVVWAVISSLGNFGWYVGYGWWYGLQYWLPTIIVTVLIIGAIAAIIVFSGKNDSSSKKKKKSSD